MSKQKNNMARRGDDRSALNKTDSTSGVANASADREDALTRSRFDMGYGANSIPGINTPEVSSSLPAFNPPVPNRAWTAMRMGVDIDELSEEEKRELYYGRDNI